MNILLNIPLFKDVKVPYGNYMSCILRARHAKVFSVVKNILLVKITIVSYVKLSIF